MTIFSERASLVPIILITASLCFSCTPVIGPNLGSESQALLLAQKKGGIVKGETGEICDMPEPALSFGHWLRFKRGKEGSMD